MIEAGESGSFNNNKDNKRVEAVQRIGVHSDKEWFIP